METAMVHEAVALFDDPKKLEAAVSELQSRGVDRANLSFLAHDVLAQRPSASAGRLAEAPRAAREAVLTEPDLRQGRVLGTGMAATIAAFAAAGFTVATGGAIAAIAAAAAAAAAAGGAVGTWIGRKIEDDEEAFLDAQLARGGVVLWVRTPDSQAVRTVVEVLRRHSPHVRLHGAR
jgi:hypothetical protein